MIKSMLVMLSMVFCSFILKGQNTASIEDYIEENAWYITPIPYEKLDDPRNNFGQIEFKPTSFDQIPFPIDDRIYQYYLINDSEEMLVLKPMELIEKEYKNLTK